MSTLNNMDVRLVKALEQYERRLQGAKRHSNKYYHKNVHAISEKRVIEAIGRGVTPIKRSLEKYDRVAITEAWLEYAANQTELSNRAKAFHLYLTGIEWVPICACV